MFTSFGSFSLNSLAQHIRSPYSKGHLGAQVTFSDNDLLVSAPNLGLYAPEGGAIYRFTLPLIGTSFFTLDEDQDGFGRQIDAYNGCYRKENHIADQTDCDDIDSSSSPVSEETCQEEGE